MCHRLTAAASLVLYHSIDNLDRIIFTTVTELQSCYAVAPELCTCTRVIAFLSNSY